MSQFTEKHRQLKGPWDVSAVYTDDDGEHELFFTRITQPRSSQEVQSVEQTELDGLAEVVVDEEVTKLGLSLSFNSFEPVSPKFQELFIGRGSTQTHRSTVKLVRCSRELELHNTQAHELVPRAMLQVLSNLPAPTLGSASAVTGGSLAADEYFIFAAAVWWRADLTAATLKTKLAAGTAVRGIDFHVGTPSASVSATTDATNNGIDVLLTPATTGPTPDGHLVIVSTANDWADASAKIDDEVYAATGAIAVGITALGTTSAGAVPTADNETIVQSNDGSHNWTTRTAGTDYSINRASGSISRIATGSISNGQTVRVTYWRIQTYTISTLISPAAGKKLQLYLRFRSLTPYKKSTADDHVLRGCTIDMPCCNVGFDNQDIFTNGDQAFHDPVGVNISPQWDSATESFGEILCEDPSLEPYVAYVDKLNQAA